MYFSHEKLEVYQRSIQFVAWSQTIIETLPSKVSAKGQLDRASTSIPLNLAEGNAKFSKKDRSRFWQIALGSTVECAAILDVLVARKLKFPEELNHGKKLLSEIVAMILALLNNLGTQVSEDITEYLNSQFVINVGELEQEQE
jgi:four helix bundle protein